MIDDPDPDELAPKVRLLSAHKPNQDLIETLEQLLAEAKDGTMRGVAYVAFKSGSQAYKYGTSGRLGMAEYALSIATMQHDMHEAMRHGEEEEDVPCPE